jgi:hypothetical protein
MTQTKQPQPAVVPAAPGPHKHWELFWRIIAGLMIIIIAWIAWVLYQISPRSVVTPLVYESQLKRGGAQPSDAGAAAAAPQPAPATSVAKDGAAGVAVPQPAPEAAAAALLMEQTQAALRSGAHQSSADVQAAVLEPRVEPVRGARLKLSTEITTPLPEDKSMPKQEEARPGGAPPVPSAADQAGKVRP